MTREKSCRTRKKFPRAQSRIKKSSACALICKIFLRAARKMWIRHCPTVSESVSKYVEVAFLLVSICNLFRKINVQVCGTLFLPTGCFSYQWLFLRPKNVQSLWELVKTDLLYPPPWGGITGFDLFKILQNSNMDLYRHQKYLKTTWTYPEYLAWCETNLFWDENLYKDFFEQKFIQIIQRGFEQVNRYPPGGGG